MKKLDKDAKIVIVFIAILLTIGVGNWFMQIASRIEVVTAMVYYDEHNLPCVETYDGRSWRINKYDYEEGTVVYVSIDTQDPKDPDDDLLTAVR